MAGWRLGERLSSIRDAPTGSRPSTPGDRDAAEDHPSRGGLLRPLREGRVDPYWVEINRLENEGDRVYRQTVARLFSGDYKAMDVLKWKDLVDQLEAAVDGCEDVANTLESIVLKHA